MSDPIIIGEPPPDLPTLVLLTTAKVHLRIVDTDHDADIQLKIDQASDAVVGWLKHRADPAWTPATVPDDVKAGILLYLTYLYEHRGDDLAPNDTDAPVWAAIERLLIRRRDPAYA